MNCIAFEVHTYVEDFRSRPVQLCGVGFCFVVYGDDDRTGEKKGIGLKITEKSMSHNDNNQVRSRGPRRRPCLYLALASDTRYISSY